MKNIFFVILLSQLFLFQSCKHSSKCIIKGQVTGYSNSLKAVLWEYGQDYRKEGIDININPDGSFEYECEVLQPKYASISLWNINSGEMFYRLSFILEQGNIEIKLDTLCDIKNHSAIGGVNNKAFNNYYNYMHSLRNTANNIFDSLNLLMNEGKFYTVINGDEIQYTTEGTIFLERINKHSESYLKRQVKFIQEHDELVSVFVLADIFILGNLDLLLNDEVKKCQSQLSQKFSDNPTMITLNKLFESKLNIQVGKKFIDFEAPDLDGNKYKLSELIEGKYAILDLWATWCSSCITTTNSYLPIYNKYKDDGFIIVGVAGEFGNLDNLRKFLSKNNFPWQNLVELDKENDIWNKYDCPNAGGKTFLFDKNGAILSINPTAEELDSILSEKFKETLHNNVYTK